MHDIKLQCTPPREASYSITELQVNPIIASGESGTPHPRRPALAESFAPRSHYISHAHKDEIGDKANVIAVLRTP